MELRDFEIFVRVAEDGDFSAAARTLSLTPSAVSKSIARLEEHLGRRLLHRSSRSMRLTPEGQSFLDAVHRVLAAIEEAEAVGSAVPSGTLRIRSVPTFARYQLAPLMPAFRRLHPKLRIEFLLTNERTAWLDDGVDVAIASGEEDMDINCGTIVDGHETVQEAGQRIFERILQVASGERTKSEQLDAGSNEFAPWPIGATV